MEKREIDSLLEKLGEGGSGLTLGELRELKGVFESFEGRHYIEQKIVSATEGASDAPYEYDFDGLYASIQKRISHRRAGRRLVNRAMRIAAAVAVPALVAVGVMLYTGRGENGTAIARAEDNVSLTLPDGSQIVMDSGGGDGVVTQREDVVLTREQGSLLIEKHPQGAAGASEPLYGELYVPRGTRFDIVLEDGTHVWLNSDSRMRFPTVFGGGERRLYLEGEAYFEVAHDAGRPFVVESAGQELRVLGTSFNLSAYADEHTVYTTLVEGSIALKSQQSGAEVVLSPGEQARLDGGGFTTARVDTGSLALWKDGLFVFEGNTLEQVMRELARWYDMEYTFADPEARGLVLRGLMPAQSDIEGIFEILETSGKVRFSINNNHVTISTLR